jgi:hypothetical protein
MKKKLFLIITVLLFLGIGVAVFAYNKAAAGKQTAMSCCCCKGDSCPMKNKDMASMDAKSCCDNCDCCKGDSCPMKTKGQTTDSTTTQTVPTAAGDAKTCDCSCCHDKDAKTQT